VPRVKPRFVAMLEPYFGSLAPLLVPGYAFLLVLGSVLAAIVIVDEARRAGFARRDAITVLCIAYACGLAGACLVPVLQGVAVWVQRGHYAPPSGMAAYGGLIGGVTGGSIALWRMKLGVWRFLDACAPGVGLGYFFARLGCFSAGCDFGVVTGSRFGTTFPAGSYAFRDQVAAGALARDASASLPVHPTQLYSALSGVVLYLVLRTLPCRPAPREGERFVALVVGYAFLRSIIELFRGDVSRGHVGPLSLSQMLAVVSVALTLALWRARRVSSA
jgi:phosphatidylglycerol:prolipoprotein diacylglycerol transferase